MTRINPKIDSLRTRILSGRTRSFVGVTNEEFMELGIESETKELIIRSNKEPISEQYENWAVLQASINQVKQE